MGQTIFQRSPRVHLALPAIFVVALCAWVFIAGERLPIPLFVGFLVVMPFGTWLFYRPLVADLEWDGTNLSGHRFAWLGTGAPFDIRADATTNWRLDYRKGRLAGISFTHEGRTHTPNVRAAEIIDFSAIRQLAPNLEARLSTEKNRSLSDV